MEQPQRQRRGTPPRGDILHTLPVNSSPPRERDKDATKQVSSLVMAVLGRSRSNTTFSPTRASFSNAGNRPLPPPITVENVNVPLLAFQNAEEVKSRILSPGEESSNVTLHDDECLDIVSALNEPPTSPAMSRAHMSRSSTATTFVSAPASLTNSPPSTPRHNRCASMSDAARSAKASDALHLFRGPSRESMLKLGSSSEDFSVHENGSAEGMMSDDIYDEHVGRSSSALSLRASQATTDSGLEDTFGASRKTSQRMLRKLFQGMIPDDETLYDDHICAFLRDLILQQGKLFLTYNYFCFASNILGFETKIAIPISDIQSIDRAKTANLIPNAINVRTEYKTYFFTSFVARDTAFSNMIHLLSLYRSRSSPSLNHAVPATLPRTPSPRVMPSPYDPDPFVRGRSKTGPVTPRHKESLIVEPRRVITDTPAAQVSPSLPLLHVHHVPLASAVPPVKIRKRRMSKTSASLNISLSDDSVSVKDRQQSGTFPVNRIMIAGVIVMMGILWIAMTWGSWVLLWRLEAIVSRIERFAEESGGLI